MSRKRKITGAIVLILGLASLISGVLLQHEVEHALGQSVGVEQRVNMALHGVSYQAVQVHLMYLRYGSIALHVLGGILLLVTALVFFTGKHASISTEQAPPV